MKKLFSFYFMIFSTMVFAIAFFVLPLMTNANHDIVHKKADHDFPRIAAMQLNAGIASAQELSRFDTLILEINAQNTHPQFIRDLRRFNPDIVILAYTSAIENFSGALNRVEPQGFGIWHDMVAGYHPEWELTTWQGDQLSFWPTHTVMNLTAKNSQGVTYANYLSDFLYREALQTGLWDGLFFDQTWDTVSWFSEDIDMNGDGRKDSKEFIDQQWHNGQEDFLAQLRAKTGDRYLLITNGFGKFENVNNGRMFEGFPEFWEGGWEGSLPLYLATDSKGYTPRFNIINADTNDTGNFTNYKFVRYTLTSAMLGNGYYSYDYGPADRSYTPYYDEYNVSLGRATAGAFNLLGGATASATSVAPGVWRRDFENGISIVNSSTSTRTITLPGEFEKLRGNQDPFTNNGRVVSKVTVPAQDGLILLRPLQEVIGGVYENGVFSRVFSANSQVSRSSFFSFDERFDGGTRIIKDDLEEDGRIETIVAGKSAITIYADNGSVRAVFYPYTSAYQSGINLGIGDLNGDGTKEIITGTEVGGGPQVRIFNKNGKLINPGFFAYAEEFRGGVHIAVGDLNGDGINEIIAGAGYSGGPHIRIFNKDGRLINPGFFAYDPAFRGGVYVATGDINGDGIDEVISGAGPGGGPHVRVWNNDGHLLQEFFGFTPQSNAGVEVAAYDYDGDRRDEIVTMTSDFFAFN